ncbi:MAG: hypothetical protein QM726_10170 [Chitinophagaceae bacterium]
MKKQFILYMLPRNESYGSSIQYVKSFSDGKPEFSGLRTEADFFSFFKAYWLAFRYGLSVLPAALA